MKQAIAGLLRHWANRLDPKPAPQISITYQTSPNLTAQLKNAYRIAGTNRY